MVKLVRRYDVQYASGNYGATISHAYFHTVKEAREFAKKEYTLSIYDTLQKKNIYSRPQK